MYYVLSMYVLCMYVCMYVCTMYVLCMYVCMYVCMVLVVHVYCGVIPFIFSNLNTLINYTDIIYQFHFTCEMNFSVPFLS
jgi:hypothetical protein